MTDTFGTRLRHLRARAGLTQREAADAACIAQPYWSNLENGVKADPSWTTVQALANALGCSTEALRTDGMGR